MGGSQGSQDLGKALLRIVLGVLILMHGIAKVTGASGIGFVAKVVADAGLPAWVAYGVYIGEVVAFHLSSAVYDGHRVDAQKMRPLARLGGPFYSGLGEIFHRPMLQKPPGGEGSAG
ncbi:hypothetical protein D3C72_1972350 [compost metagenome]